MGQANYRKNKIIELEGKLAAAKVQADSQELEWRRVSAERDEIEKSRDAYREANSQLAETVRRLGGAVGESADEGG